MPSTTLGSLGHGDARRPLDPLLHLQMVSHCRLQAHRAASGQAETDDAPINASDPSIIHEMAKLALIIAADQVASSRGKTLVEQLAIWRPFR